MKNLLILCIITVVSLTSYSQTQFGIKTSIMHTFSTSESVMLKGEHRAIYHNLTFVNQRPSTSIGLTFYKSFERIWVETGLQLTKQEKQYQVMEYETNVSSNVIDKQLYITVPIMAGINLNKYMRVGAGPVFRKLIDNDLILLEYSNFNQSKRTTSNGFQCLLGFNLSKLIHLDLTFEQGLMITGQEYNYYNAPIEYKNRQQHVGLNITLLIP